MSRRREFAFMSGISGRAGALLAGKRVAISTKKRFWDYYKLSPKRLKNFYDIKAINAW